MEFLLFVMALTIYFFGRSIGAFFLGWILTALFSLFFPIIKVVNSSYARWDKLPTIQQYLELNPSCKAQRGITCKVCNSSSIRNWGIAGPDHKYRIFLCNHCDSDLYKK